MKTDTQKRTLITKIIFWAGLVIGSIGGFFIWKDLADISQWIVTSPREQTMAVWYYRWEITIVSFIAMAISAFIWIKNRVLLGTKTYSAIMIIFFFNWYTGFVNPDLMMRERQHDGLILSIEEAKRFVKPDESVIVIDINGHARAHPDHQVLRPHVAGNSEKLIGGENVVMTYCGLTNMGIAYTPEINGVPLALRPRTQLENNLVMVDDISGEPVQQMWGQKEADVVAGNSDRMQEWPTFRMPFSKFEQAYPEGEVFINDYISDGYMTTFWQNPIKYVYEELANYIFALAIDTQRDLERPTFPTIEFIDQRLPGKELVWGVNIGTDHVAYTEAFVKQQAKPINTSIGGQDVVITYDTELESLGIFYNDTGIKVDEIDFYGHTGDSQLKRVETVKAGAYWVIWANFYPESEINRS